MKEEAIDGAFNHIASEMNKGRSFEQAATTSGSVTPSQGSSGSSSSNAAPRITGTSAAPEVGHGKLIPETPTSTEHVDLARRRAENLEKIAAKRKLDPHEQSVYDNARRIRDRNAPGQSEGGSRPQDAAPEDSQRPHSPENPPAEVSDSAKRPPGDAHPEATTAADPNQAPPTAPEVPRSHGASNEKPDTKPDDTRPSDAPSSPESRQQPPITPTARPSTPP